MAISNVRHKLLALDGGGIRGVLTLGVLEAIERIVDKPLHEYFDYIAGTSTGAIIAAGLACGEPVSKLLQFYKDFGPAMFEKRFFLERYKSLYGKDALAEKLQSVFGRETTLSSDRLKTLLLVVTRNWTTDSPWPISSNPNARYNKSDRKDCNLQIPLWQLVRASTAAPVYFPPEVIQWDKDDRAKSFVFVDGGVTPYNNPAFLLYRMATLPHYGLNWEIGEDKLLLISIGTGSAPKIGPQVDNADPSMLPQVESLVPALMYGSEVDQDINCRTVGRCVYGDVIDRELLDMVPREGDACKAMGTVEERRKCEASPLSKDLKRHFLYARYNADFSAEGLGRLGFPNADLKRLSRMDLATQDNIADLYAIGGNVGKCVSRDHFGPFL